jgi:hypothetical protein
VATANAAALLGVVSLAAAWSAQKRDSGAPADFDADAACDGVAAGCEALHVWRLRLVGILYLLDLVPDDGSILCARQDKASTGLSDAAVGESENNAEMLRAG